MSTTQYPIMVPASVPSDLLAALRNYHSSHFGGQPNPFPPASLDPDDDRWATAFPLEIAVMISGIAAACRQTGSLHVTKETHENSFPLISRKATADEREWAATVCYQWGPSMGWSAELSRLKD